MKGYSGPSIAKTYQRSQVIHANPAELVVMLYDGALSRIAEAKQRFSENNLLYGGIAVTKAQAIVNELRRSLNPEAGGEIAANLDNLYFFIHEQLVKATLEYHTKHLDAAARMLGELRSAWVEVAKLCKEAIEKDPTLQIPSVIPKDAPVERPRLSVKA